MLNYFVIVKSKPGIPPSVMWDRHQASQWLRNQNIFFNHSSQESFTQHSPITKRIISFVQPQHIEAYFCCLTISHFCNYVNENSREIRLWRLAGRCVFFSSSPPKRWLLVILWFLIFDCCSFLLLFFCIFVRCSLSLFFLFLFQCHHIYVTIFIHVNEFLCAKTTTNIPWIQKDRRRREKNLWANVYKRTHYTFSLLFLWLLALNVLPRMENTFDKGLWSKDYKLNSKY